MALGVILILLLLMPHKTAGQIEDGDEQVVATSTTEMPLSIPEKKPLTVIEKIKLYSEEYNLDYELNVKVAKAESHFINRCNYLYTDERGMYTACGIYQITRTTYRSFCGDPSERFDVDKNIQCAMKIMSTSGYHHWNESKQNWK